MNNKCSFNVFSQSCNKKKLPQKPLLGGVFLVVMGWKNVTKGGDTTTIDPTYSGRNYGICRDLTRSEIKLQAHDNDTKEPDMSMVFN